jgi:cytochrome c553
LKAFRSGKRQSDVMNIMAKPLTDDDIAVLADWYSSIMIEAKEKP